MASHCIRLPVRLPQDISALSSGQPTVLVHGPGMTRCILQGVSGVTRQVPDFQGALPSELPTRAMNLAQKGSRLSDPADFVALNLWRLNATTSTRAASLAVHLQCSLLLDPEPCDGAADSFGGACQACTCSVIGLGTEG